jgi:lysophospholipase L1-like esterase
MCWGSDCTINSKSRLGIFLLFCLIIAGCKPTLDEPKYMSGEADFSVYVAVGNSFTAGYMDNALTLEGQLQSFPNLLANQFLLAKGGAFKQPLVNPGNGFGFDFETQMSTGKWILINALNCANKNDVELKTLAVNPADKTWIGNQGPFNNMGVPGAKSFNLYSQLFGKGGVTGNPYFYRIASDTGASSSLSSTVLGDVVALDPTFFTLWIGINDVLMYAMKGGQPNGNSLYEITPVPQFDAAIDTIISELSSNGTKGLVANIPDIADLPFFNTIPYNGLILTKAEADSLNILSPPGIIFKEGANPYVVSNPGGGSIRQLKEGEMLLLSINRDSLLCFAKGTTQRPIESTKVLDTAEMLSIRNAVQAFNSKLRSAALTNGLAFADMNSFFKSFTKGFVFNGANYTTAYLKGGAFSLDGIHPNGRGYAIIANEFIRVINAKYGSNLPPVDVNASTGVLNP